MLRRPTLLRLIGLSPIVLAMPDAIAAPEINGVWARGDGNAHVRIAPCGADLCAVNIWVKDTSKGEAVGDTLVMMVKPQAPGRYTGTAYDRKRKLTVSMDISVEPKRLKSRGCMLGGLACRSVSWSRLH
jgi:uncharacterized protein (DUF2147 family)